MLHRVRRNGELLQALGKLVHQVDELRHRASGETHLAHESHDVAAHHGLADVDGEQPFLLHAVHRRGHVPAGFVTVVVSVELLLLARQLEVDGFVRAHFRLWQPDGELAVEHHQRPHQPPPHLLRQMSQVDSLILQPQSAGRARSNGKQHVGLLERAGLDAEVDDEDERLRAEDARLLDARPDHVLRALDPRGG